MLAVVCAILLLFVAWVYGIRFFITGIVSNLLTLTRRLFINLLCCAEIARNLRKAQLEVKKAQRKDYYKILGVDKNCGTVRDCTAMYFACTLKCSYFFWPFPAVM